MMFLRVNIFIYIFSLATWVVLTWEPTLRDEKLYTEYRVTSAQVVNN
jgi:hypothetical protein